MIRRWVLTTESGLTSQRLTYSRRCFTEWSARIAAAGMNRGYPSLNWIVVFDPEGRYAISDRKANKEREREKYASVPRRARDVKVYRSSGR